MVTGLNSLGFAKSPHETRVVVAMSGGVDSSVVAGLLHEQGYDVVGITLQLYDHGIAIQKKGACCAGQDIYDARNVAEKLGIPHYVLDYESKFHAAVMDKFADSYLRGETPIPCVECNQSVKFKDLLATAKDLGADCLATGHYVRREGGLHNASLHRAVDTTRDQSYFLFATTQDQLDYIRFPLGAMPKTEVRALAEKYALPVAQKPDSQDICFVPDGDYATIVRRLRPDAADTGGDIVDIAGKVLGQHNGVINFTIGQRRGVGVAGGTPLYVIRLEPETRRVVVGPKEALARDIIYVRDINWLGAHALSATPQAIHIKVRSLQPLVSASIVAGDAAGHAVITLDTPQYGVAPGQAAVFYHGDHVLGGGWITGADLKSGFGDLVANL